MASSNVSIDVFELDPATMGRNAVNAVRTAFGIVGLLSVALGVVLLVWPGKTAVVITAIIGIYALVAGIARTGLGIFSRGISGGHRTLNIILGLVLLIAGIVALRNLDAAAATVVLIAVIVLGISWIIEGIVALVESGSTRSRGWAVTYGIISILAGIAVLAWPGMTAVVFAWIAGIMFLVLGIFGIVRAFTFGKGITATEA